jgi:hypothetical protein
LGEKIEAIKIKLVGLEYDSSKEAIVVVLPSNYLHQMFESVWNRGENLKRSIQFTSQSVKYGYETQDPYVLIGVRQVPFSKETPMTARSEIKKTTTMNPMNFLEGVMYFGESPSAFEKNSCFMGSFAHQATNPMKNAAYIKVRNLIELVPAKNKMEEFLVPVYSQKIGVQ